MKERYGLFEVARDDYVTIRRTFRATKIGGLWEVYDYRTGALPAPCLGAFETLKGAADAIMGTTNCD